jgi:poly(hydroxyalkanoate) depolymerase family esterase
MDGGIRTHPSSRTLGRCVFGALAVHRWVAAIALLGTGAIHAAPEVLLNEVREFGSNPGNLRMFKYVPPALPASAALVVALHGCTQRASDYDDETGWTSLAQRHRFALLLPEQQSGNNARLCFNWFNGRAFSDWWFWYEWGSDQDRDAGEASSIKQMIDRIKADHPIDARRVYVTGLSAGGAMAAVMLAAYPEMFAGGGILAGVPYKCARTSAEALTQCGIDLNNAGGGHITNLTPATWGKRVRDATDFRGPWPRVSIWQGDADQTVSPENARELMEQWTAIHGIDQIPDTEEKIKGFPHRVYRDARGTAIVETYSIAGMAHGVPVDPGTGREQCGHAGPRTFSVGICSSYYLGKFWGLTR